jgi:hypothetical protein
VTIRGWWIKTGNLKAILKDIMNKKITPFSFKYLSIINITNPVNV